VIDRPIKTRNGLMLIDSHCHIFTTRIVENMRARPALVEALQLNVRDAEKRLDPAALQVSAEENHIELCVLLPSAGPNKIRSENDRFVGFTRTNSRLRTLATLHPMMSDPTDEISRMVDLGIIGFKFSSFSQRFNVSTPEMETMLAQLERSAGRGKVKPTAVFDTFARGDVHMGANPDHLTTPFKVSRLVDRHPGINFIAAHMGGLLAPFDELCRDLGPAPNLFLDTSNAAHTLGSDQFIDLLRIHRSSHILFGTDWPWFVHGNELAKIGRLLEMAGYDQSDRDAVFGENARRLFGF